MPLPLLVALALMSAPQVTPQDTPSTPPRTPAAGLTDLKVSVLTPSAGEAVRVGDVVEVNYVGKLAAANGGTEFDRSKEKPFRFQVGLGNVIAGWDRGLVGINVGGKYRFEIPAALGYGERGAPPVIPANADLDFEVEVLRILPRTAIAMLKEGKGEAVKPTDAVSFNYIGTLKNGGKKFDSSYDRKAPLQVEVRRLVPGMVQGLIGMKPGEKRRVTIPSELAYGAQGIPARDAVDEKGQVLKAGSLIPGGSDLVFEIELVEVLKPKG